MDQDFDGDGHPDFVVGMNDPDRGVGEVRFVPGPVLGVVPADSAAWTLTGAEGEVGSVFGYSLAWFPDQDGDTRPEILVSDPGWEQDTLWVVWSAGLP